MASSLDNVLIARENRVIKAMAQTKLMARQNDNKLEDRDLYELMRVHGRFVMQQVIKKLAPVVVDGKLAFTFK